MIFKNKRWLPLILVLLCFEGTNATVANAIAEVKSGTFKAANYKEWTMMRKGGASLAPYYEFDSKIPAAAKAKVEEVKAAILSGAFDVEIIDVREATMEEVAHKHAHGPGGHQH